MNVSQANSKLQLTCNAFRHQYLMYKTAQTPVQFSVVRNFTPNNTHEPQFLPADVFVIQRQHREGEDTEPSYTQHTVSKSHHLHFLFHSGSWNTFFHLVLNFNVGFRPSLYILFLLVLWFVSGFQTSQCPSTAMNDPMNCDHDYDCHTTMQRSHWRSPSACLLEYKAGFDGQMVRWKDGRR